MKKKPIAIAFSDHHWANWKQFNKNEERLEAALSIFLKVQRKAKELELPILFAGDMIDHPAYIENSVFDYLTEGLKSTSHIIGINGNHDFNKVNTFDNPVRGYMHSLAKAYEKVHCIDFKSKALSDYLVVHGIPYINGNIDFIEALKDRVSKIESTKNKKHHILLTHRDYAGAVEPNGKEVPKERDEYDKEVRKLFKHFDLVLSGHIHKPQKLLKFGKHVYMLGATHQQRRSDAGCRMGFWVIYSDMSLKFIDAKGPEFRYHKEDEEPPNDGNFWIKTPNLKKVERSNNSSNEFTVNTDREKLVKSYMVEKGHKSKAKLKTALKYL